MPKEKAPFRRVVAYLPRAELLDCGHVWIGGGIAKRRRCNDCYILNYILQGVSKSPTSGTSAPEKSA